MRDETCTGPRRARKRSARQRKPKTRYAWQRSAARRSRRKNYVSRSNEFSRQKTAWWQCEPRQQRQQRSVAEAELAAAEEEAVRATAEAAEEELLPESEGPTDEPVQ